MNTVEAAFAPLIGQPCWNVRCGYGSFLTLQWGQPHLEIREPQPESKWRSQRRRNVFIKGDRQLRLQMCDWWVFEAGKKVASSHTKLTVQPAIQLLDGQKLTAITVNHLAGRSIFSFDLKTELHTRPYQLSPSSRSNPDEDKQWQLFEPDGMVLSLRGDGAYRHHPGTTLVGEGDYIAREEWGGVPGKYRLPPGVSRKAGGERINKKRG